MINVKTTFFMIQILQNFIYLFILFFWGGGVQQLGGGGGALLSWYPVM